MWMTSVRRLGLVAPLGFSGAPASPEANRAPGFWRPTVDVRHGAVDGSWGEVDPGGLEDVLATVAGDRIQAAVLQADEAVERALRDQVGHRELPAEGARGRVLVPLLRAGDVGDVAHQVQHAHRTLAAAQTEDYLVGESLAEGLHRHLAGVQQVRHGLRHRDAVEVPRRRVDVREVQEPRT